MKKRFNWKQFIGKRVLSLLMIFVMFMGVVPVSLVNAMAAVGIGAGRTATIEKLDTNTVSVDDLKNSSMSAPSRYAEAGVRYKVKDSGADWETKVSGNVTLTHGTTYEVQEIYTQLIRTTYSSSYYITFKKYHNVSVAVTETADLTGTGASVSVTKVYSGENATITVNGASYITGQTHEYKAAASFHCPEKCLK